MKIIIAKNSGFCMGVRIAMNTILKHVHESAGPIQTLGPLIHNPQTMELLRKKNVTAAENPQAVSADTVVIRTHGVSPHIQNEIKTKAKQVIDATCPHVKRIHRIIDGYFRNGFGIIIFGDKDHAEVEGLMGCARDKGYVISSKEQIAGLPPFKEVCLVAQTTQSLRNYEEIKETVGLRYPNAKIFNTICRATDERQVEVEKLAQWTDAVVVVGGKNSANTTRLASIAAKTNPKVFHIETEDELKPTDFYGLKRVSVVSGASTPSWLLNRVTERLKQIGNAQRPAFVRVPLKLLEVLIYFDIYLAMGAALMTWTASLLQAQPVNVVHMVIAGLYINSMYILNRLTKIKADQYEEVFKMDYVHRNRRVSIAICIITGLSSIGFAYTVGFGEFMLVLLACVAGILYHVNILPKNDFPFLRHRKLKDITLSKDIGISLAWSVICVLSPYAGRDFLVKIKPGEAIVTFLFVFIIVFIRTIIHDLYDIQRDRIVGRETLPIVLGKRFNNLFPYPLLIIAALVPLTGALLGHIPVNGYLLSACSLYFYFIYSLFNKNKLTDSMIFDIVVDFIFIVPITLLLIGYLIF
jgi:4-hydroxy-3-methylbut-2-enyl diphosphate reductase